jgi:hypothetical protein
MAVRERDRLPEQERAPPLPPARAGNVDYLKSRGYNPVRFLGMTAQEGSALAVAKRLFSDPRPARTVSSGYGRLGRRL